MARHLATKNSLRGERQESLPRAPNYLGCLTEAWRTTPTGPVEVRWTHLDGAGIFSAGGG